MEFKLNGVVYTTVDDRMADYGDLVIANNRVGHVFKFDINCAAVSDEYSFTVVKAVDCHDNDLN